MRVTFHQADIKFSLRHRRALGEFILRQITTDLTGGTENRQKTILLSFIFCSDEYLLDLNKKFLKHDDYTDIIAFPITENKHLLEAEIYISIDRVGENSLKYNVQGKYKGTAEADTVGFNKELRRVMFHGVLHLFGYKDKTREQKARIQKKEDEWLNKFESFLNR